VIRHPDGERAKRRSTESILTRIRYPFGFAGGAAPCTMVPIRLANPMKRTRAHPLPPALKLAITGIIVASPLILALSRVYLSGQVDHFIIFLVTGFIGALFIYIGVTDIVSGEIRSSRYGITAVVLREDTPISFWALICLTFLGGAMFLLLAASHLHVVACCDSATLKRFITHLAAVALVALCVHVGETVIVDLRAGEVRGGAGRRPVATRDASPKGYWASIALRIGFLAVIAGLITALYADAAPR
jgi:hypothetical protein